MAATERRRAGACHRRRVGGKPLRLNTFWELEAEQVTAEPGEDGSWRVMLNVRARKLVVDEAGVETEVPMNDSAKIGIFDDKGLNEPIYLHKHRISAAKQTITVTVPRKPTSAGIDPIPC